MKKSIKKLLALTLTGAFLVGALTGCGKSGEDDKTITVAASATPHAEILEYAKDKLKEQGYDLQVTVFDDYVKPNEDSTILAINGIAAAVSGTIVAVEP